MICSSGGRVRGRTDGALHQTILNILYGSHDGCGQKQKDEGDK